MNRIANKSISGVDWNEIEIPAGLTVYAVAIQCRTSADITFAFTNTATETWLIRAGTVLSLSWGTTHTGVRLWVKGTPGTVVEAMLATMP